MVSGNVVGLFPGERAGLVGRRLGDFILFFLFSWSVAWASSAREVAHAALFCVVDFLVDFS